MIEILLLKCSSGNCQPDSVINQVLNSNYLDFAMVNAYFDYNDYENPVKTYLEDLNVFGSFEMLLIVGSLCISTLASRIFNNALFGRLYQVEDFKTPSVKIQPKTSDNRDHLRSLAEKGVYRSKKDNPDCAEEESKHKDNLESIAGQSNLGNVNTHVTSMQYQNNDGEL